MIALETVELASSTPITSSSSDHAGYSFHLGTIPPSEILAASAVTTIHVGAADHTIDQFLCGKFRELADQWKEETIHVSSLTELENHEAYRKIVELGAPVIPLILQELVDDPDWWFMALHALVDDPPASEGIEGNLMTGACDWIKWGQSNGYLREE